MLREKQRKSENENRKVREAEIDKQRNKEKSSDSAYKGWSVLILLCCDGWDVHVRLWKFPLSVCETDFRRQILTSEVDP